MHEADAHNSKIPAPEDGGHARSQAAHLKTGTSLHDNHDASRHAVVTEQTTTRELPQDLARSREHRKQ